MRPGLLVTWVKLTVVNRLRPTKGPVSHRTGGNRIFDQSSAKILKSQQFLTRSKIQNDHMRGIRSLFTLPGAETMGVGQGNDATGLVIHGSGAAQDNRAYAYNPTYMSANGTLHPHHIPSNRCCHCWGIFELRDTGQSCSVSLHIQYLKAYEMQFCGSI